MVLQWPSRGLNSGFRARPKQISVVNLPARLTVWGENMSEWIPTAEVPLLLLQCLCALAQLSWKHLVGGSSDGNSHIAGMFCLLSANALAATPSPLYEAFPADSLSSRDSATSLAMYVWTQGKVFVHLWLYLLFVILDSKICALLCILLSYF